jgi:anthranilate synthase component I
VARHENSCRIRSFITYSKKIRTTRLTKPGFFLEKNETVRIKVFTEKFLADTFTPVSLYARLRDHYAPAVLLESSDLHDHQQARSFIGLQPVSIFEADQNKIQIRSGNDIVAKVFSNENDLIKQFEEFRQSFQLENENEIKEIPLLFGYCAFEAAGLFDTVKTGKYQNETSAIPLLHFTCFRYVLSFDPFRNELFVVEFSPDGECTLKSLVDKIQNCNTPQYPFAIAGDESCNCTDQEYIENVKRGIFHCMRGDVFQIVLSRAFKRAFHGDDFNVYRTLRSINPSPYLFYYDTGNFRVIGSSPEAQIVIQNGNATLFPIAGTYRRNGNAADDLILKEKLLNDPKENAEHVMLVDLARNDLSKQCSEVKVEVFKEAHLFSHVIHLVSKVSGKFNDKISPLKLVADTFPAGTLSGAPKYRAIELIEEIEKSARGYYGGCIGFITCEGNTKTAITIRTIFSRNNELHYRSGAGIVNTSVPENELEEVNNKLGALRQAIKEAQNIRS